MQKESGVRISALKVDGGASQNRYLMQLQADLLGASVLRTSSTESTAWGAAKLAGVASGFWSNLKRIDQKTRYERFGPKMKDRERQNRLKRWQEAVRHLIS